MGILCWKNHYSLQTAALKTEEKLQKVKRDFYTLMENKPLIGEICEGKFTTENITYLQSQTYTILVFDGSDLVYWSDNKVVPDKDDWANLRDLQGFVHLHNGYYYYTKARYTQNEKEYALLGLYLLKNEYGFENKYIENTVNPDLGITHFFAFGLSPLQESSRASIKILSDASKSSLYIFKDPLQAGVGEVDFFWLLAFVAVLLVLFACYRFCIWLNQYFPAVVGLLLWAIILLILFVGLYKFQFPIDFNAMELFMPQLFSNTYFQSVGYLLVFVVLYFLWVLYFYFRCNLTVNITNSYSQKLFLVMTAILLGWLGIIYIGVLKNLFYDSNFSISVQKYLEKDVYALACTIIVACSSIIYFLLMDKLARWLAKWQIPFREALLLLLLGLLPACIVLVFKSWIFPAFLLLLVNVVNYIWHTQKSLQKPHWYALQDNLHIIGYILGIGILLIYFEYYREQNYQIEYAQSIFNQEDKAAEYNFDQVAGNIIADEVVKQYFEVPFLPENELKERIRKKYFTNFVSEYTISTYAFNAAGKRLSGEDTPDYNEYQQKINEAIANRQAQQKEAVSNYLFPIETNFGSYNYVGKLPIFIEQRIAGYLFIELERNGVLLKKVYPELTISDRFRNRPEFENYDYAIYKKGVQQFSTSQRYSYPQKFPAEFINNKEINYINQRQCQHLVYKPNNNTSIVLTKSGNYTLKVISQLGFLFLLGLLIFQALSLFFSIKKQCAKDGCSWHILSHQSLRNKINFFVTFIILISAGSIAWISINYFVNSFTHEHIQQLKTRQQSVVNNFLLETSQQTDSLPTENMQNFINALSSVYESDINLYDQHGKLLVSSQPYIFQSFLMSRYINPKALNALNYLKGESIIENESIGKFDFLSAYKFFGPSDKQASYIINIPDFNRSKSVKRNISDFLTSLLNLYILLFIAVLLITYLLSESITRPIALIGEKMRKLDLSKTNERLHWPNDDEIGHLVKQYNATVAELELSVQRLASSERQYAWQSMAKQVAHEIKNPLTPMKLSIQHLQRVIRENRPNSNEQVLSVTQSLIEQIDHLAYIASEFSNFAKMPQTHEELLDLGAVAGAVADLYKSTETVHIQKNITAHPLRVWGDKNQLNRVFHNLVKNAIQAIADEKEGVIVVNVYQEGVNAVVSVLDNGSGIPLEKQDKVFIPNFTTKSSGMGLGLAISKNIIEQCKGDIFFEDNPAGGTIFYVKIPLA
ncbi:MAG: HAMP domain-containing sensor histidine kinase [Chitinophagales bacterium]